MRCSAARAQWIAAQDSHGEDGPRAAGLDLHADVTGHMETCEACQAYVLDDALLRRILNSDPDRPAGPDFDARFRARLAAHKATRASGTQRERRSPPAATMVWLSLAAVVTLGMVGFGLWWIPSMESRATPPRVPENKAPDTHDNDGEDELEEPMALAFGLVEDLEFALELDLLQDLPVVEELDALEAYAELTAFDPTLGDLSGVDPDQLDALLEEAEAR